MSRTCLSVLRITHGVVSGNEEWVSAVWSCHSGPSGLGGSRYRSWQRNESTGAC